MAVDVKMLYDDLRAVSDLTAAVSTNRFTGPVKEQKSEFLHRGASVTQQFSVPSLVAAVSYSTPALLCSRFLLPHVFVTSDSTEGHGIAQGCREQNRALTKCHFIF